jgi:hypothetical protein
MQHHADVFEGESLIYSSFADAYPGDVALAHVHDALDVVDQVMGLAFQDRLEVFLEFTAGHLDVDGQGQARRLLSCRRMSGPMTVTLPSSISFISAILTTRWPGSCRRPSGYTGRRRARAHPRRPGRRHTESRWSDRGFQAADFDGFLHHFVVGHIGHHVLVGADTGGQDFRDVGVGDGGKAPVHTAGRCGGPFGVDIAQGVDKGEDTRSLLYIRILL